MEIVLHIESKNLQKAKEVLLKDDTVSRASIVFKEGKSLINKEGYFCYVSGSEEQCKKAVEISKDLAKEAEAKDKTEVIAKIKEEQDKASEGFGSIFS
jgi:alpha-D-ribose 1-methylphosphonate 5-triphosphate synthase subunit PhnG